VYAYPWGQLIVAVVLVGWSLLDTIQPLLVLGWFVVVAACLVVEDLATSTSFLRTQWGAYKAKRHSPTALRPDLNEANEVYHDYREPDWFPRRSTYRRRAALTLLVATWAYALVIGMSKTGPEPAVRVSLVIWIMLFPLVTVSVTLVAQYQTWHPSRDLLIWLLLFVAGSVTALSVDSVMARWPDPLLTGAFVAMAYFSAYTARRLWAGETAYHEALGKISIDLLNHTDPKSVEQEVIEIARSHFRYDRIYILKPTQDSKSLEICHYTQQSAQLKGYRAPLDKDASITARAYLTQQPVARNSLAHCGFYHEVDQLRDTAAEIAVPVVHQNEIFGVLDVQSTTGGVFAPSDTKTLATIGRMLGATLAANRQSAIFSQLRDLWDDLDDMANYAPVTERDAFRLFAQFAQDYFGAEPTVYFPLSLSGRPVKEPMTHGRFVDKEAMSLPLLDENSRLIRLIDAWKMEFFSYDAVDDPGNSETLSSKASFARREGVRSACFVPIGSRDERLGVLFLNFREPREFDDLFRFTVQSIAQTMSRVTSGVRYRKLYSDGFGRPEMNIHGLLNAHDLKAGGVRKKADRLLEQPHAAAHQLHQCPLLELIDDLDLAHREISVAEAAVPPNFWGLGLTYQLKKFCRTLTRQKEGTAPDIRLNVDRRIESESPSVRLALYRVITEAIMNAIVHAHADAIEVTVRRERMNITLKVTNDGAPLASDAGEKSEKRGNRGIYYLLDICRRDLGADTQGTPATTADKMTYVALSIPALPMGVVTGGRAAANPAQESGQ
jgi:GAF domain-containing protein